MTSNSSGPARIRFSPPFLLVYVSGSLTVRDRGVTVMLCVKNVPTVERVIRVMMGLALLGGALAWIGPTMGGWVVGAMGMMAALSGLVGWCPMCAMAGRKLESKH